MKDKKVIKIKVDSIRTETKTDVIYDIQNDKHIHKDSMVMPLVREYRHLHFTSDEDIKNGDWALLNYPSGKEVRQMVDGVPFDNAKCINSENVVHKCGHRKIIGTTDETIFKKISLGTNEETLGVPIDYEKLEEVFHKVYYPRPQKGFLKEFCIRNGVDEVLVEREAYRNFGIVRKWGGFNITDLRFILNTNNELTIKFIQ